MGHQKAAEGEEQADGFAAHRHQMLGGTWKDQADVRLNDQKRGNAAQAIETGDVIRPAHLQLLAILVRQAVADMTLQDINPLR
ncbi:hypothetical protein [Rhizobium binae]|uniref:Transcriptional regulator n=1 Tax=Rhizobium binae TaxID=1138190 RepID=A0ABV2MH57_9HYPH|nr:hypothetical protein [Rhizobium binae]